MLHISQDGRKAAAQDLITEIDATVALPNVAGRYRNETARCRTPGTGKFVGATKSTPCPVCKGDHACRWTDDGLHYCRRNRRGEDLAGWVSFGLASNGVWGLWRRVTEATTGQPCPRCGATSLCCWTDDELVIVALDS